MDTLLGVITFWAIAAQTEAIKTSLRPLLGSAVSEFCSVQVLTGILVLCKVVVPWCVPKKSTASIRLALVLLSAYAKRISFQITTTLFTWTSRPVIGSIMAQTLILFPFYAIVVSIPLSLSKCLISVLSALALSNFIPAVSPLFIFGLAALSDLTLSQFKFTIRSVHFGCVLFLVLSSHIFAPSIPHSHLFPLQSFPHCHPSYPNLCILNSTHSVTGQVVVGEIFPGQNSPYSTPIRYLRVDHSLVGGVWLDPNSLETIQSIYPAFFVQEAVRLIEPQPENRNAILLGLGIGVVAEGLVNHNYFCSILELDPAVYEAANKYFNLPRTSEVIIEDAAIWADKYKQSQRTKKYGIVIHDFFSGGGVPSQLFTSQFWDVIGEKVLAEDGILVVNFYGSYRSIITESIARTLQEVFPSCIMLHDKLGSDTIKYDEPLNMIIFCRKLPTKLHFRDTTSLDWGSSQLRKYIFSTLQQRILSLAEIAQLPAEKFLITEQYNPLEQFQRSNSLEHWKIMNEVLPPQAWELY